MKIAVVASEAAPFVKTGGLGDVMQALPLALSQQKNTYVSLFIPYYSQIKYSGKWQTEFLGAFDVPLAWRREYVGIFRLKTRRKKLQIYFIDNEHYFNRGGVYGFADDGERYAYFSKAVLAAMNYLELQPDVVSCHDWQAALVPLYLRTCFADTNVGRASAVLTIHNLKFQGIYDRKMIQYWSGLPDYVFNKDCMIQNWLDANMLKGGIAYSNKVTTVSNTYAWEIQTEEYGEGLAEHLRYHNNKILGIVNGIDTDIWNPARMWLISGQIFIT